MDPAINPLRIEVFEAVLDEGKDDKDACRLRLLAVLAIVPLVVGLKGSTVVIVGRKLQVSHRSSSQYLLT